MALLWAGRRTELRACLDRFLRPYAPLAANRWVAWAGFVAGGLAVHEGEAGEALKSYHDAEMRFRAEALLDGVVSVKTARLAAHRLRGDSGAYTSELEEVITLSRSGDRGQRYYTRRNAFTALQADRGEPPSHATTAADKAGAIGCELILARSRQLLALPQPPDAARQIFFC
jgi:hypothetical protein